MNDQVIDTNHQVVDLWTRRVTYWLTRLMRWISAHWLLMANLAVGLWLALPLLAPVLMVTGYERTANLIYLLFRPLCHQLPERSFFLFGDRWAYSYAELSRILGGLVPARYIGGADDIGYKMAICERDVAIYLSALLSGMLFGIVRNKIKPLSFKGFGLLILPMAIDGFGQLFGLWESSWLSRLITGGLFGLACIWLAYPYLQTGMEEVHRETAAAIRSFGK